MIQLKCNTCEKEKSEERLALPETLEYDEFYHTDEETGEEEHWYPVMCDVCYGEYQEVVSEAMCNLIRSMPNYGDAAAQIFETIPLEGLEYNFSVDEPFIESIIFTGSPNIYDPNKNPI